MTAGRVPIANRVAASRSVWLPTAISGCKLWLRPDLGLTQAANKVSAWLDQSGAGNNFVQATGANQPGYVSSALNAKPGVSFAATQYLANTTFAVVQPVTYVLVVTNTSGGGVALDANSGVENAIQIAPTSILIYAGSAPSLTIPNGATPLMVETLFNGGSSWIYANGGIQGIIGNAGPNNVTGLNLGQNTAISSQYIGTILEVVAYNKVLAQSERDALTTYARIRYSSW